MSSPIPNNYTLDLQEMQEISTGKDLPWKDCITDVNMENATVTGNQNTREVVTRNSGHVEYVTVPADLTFTITCNFPMQHFKKIEELFANGDLVKAIVKKEKKTVIEKLQTGTKPYFIHEITGHITEYTVYKGIFEVTIVGTNY